MITVTLLQRTTKVCLIKFPPKLKIWLSNFKINLSIQGKQRNNFGVKENTQQQLQKSSLYNQVLTTHSKIATNLSNFHKTRTNSTKALVFFQFFPTTTPCRSSLLIKQKSKASSGYGPLQVTNSSFLWMKLNPLK